MISGKNIALRSLLGIVFIVLLIIIAPSIEERAMDEKMLQVINEKDINVGALFYTDSNQIPDPLID